MSNSKIIFFPKVKVRLKQAVMNVLMPTYAFLCGNRYLIFRKQEWHSKWIIVFLTWWTWMRILSCLKCFSTWSKRVRPQWANSRVSPAMTSSWQEPSLLTSIGKNKALVELGETAEFYIIIKICLRWHACLFLIIFIIAKYHSVLSVITNIHGTISIIPMENAKTFVNGILISESTTLHHVSKMSWTTSSPTLCCRGFTGTSVGSLCHGC